MRFILYFIKVFLGFDTPKSRASNSFRAFKNRLTYEPFEEVIYTSLDYVRTIAAQGDYLEFGVWKGRTFTTAYHFAKSLGLDMTYYAFDSFKGLPELSEEDRMHKEYTQGGFACSSAEFKKILTKNEVDEAHVKLVKGFYRDSLTPALKKTIALKEAAIIMIDCDLYESTKQALDFSTTYIRSGTVIIFEDWFCYKNDPNFGEQRAFMEWLKENPQFHASDFAIQPTLKAFVMYRSAE